MSFFNCFEVDCLNKDRLFQVVKPIGSHNTDFKKGDIVHCADRVNMMNTREKGMIFWTHCSNMKLKEKQDASHLPETD